MTPIILAAASCLMIADPDQRAYCRALESGNQARCVEIQNYDLRQRCRVELGGNPANCMTISDPQQRALCQAKAGLTGFEWRFGSRNIGGFTL